MSGLRLIAVERLTREAFEPFGDVIDTHGPAPLLINQGRTERFHQLAGAECLGEGARAILSIFRGQPLLPLEIHMMERHPLGSQAFVPMNGGDFLAVVAPPGDFNETEVRAFWARGGQGVNYRPGTWHAPLLPLAADSDYLVVDRAGPGVNCDEVLLNTPIQPVLPEEGS